MLSTSMVSKEETEKFYEQLKNQLNEMKCKNNNIFNLEDWNSQIRQREKREKRYA